MNRKLGAEPARFRPRFSSLHQCPCGQSRSRDTSKGRYRILLRKRRGRDTPVRQRKVSLTSTGSGTVRSGTFALVIPLLKPESRPLFPNSDCGNPVFEEALPDWIKLQPSCCVVYHLFVCSSYRHPVSSDFSKLSRFCGNGIGRT